MWQYIKLLLASWFSKVLFLLGIVSAIGTYVPRITLPAWVSPVILVAAVFFASYDVYRKQIRENEALKAKNTEKRSQLVIYPHDGSKYFVLGSEGTYVMLKMAIENKGNRNSTVNRYGISVRETSADHKDINPNPMTTFLGRDTTYSIGNQPWLMSDSLVRVAAEGVASPGFLPFRLPDTIPGDCHQIQCELTIQDTEGNIASQVFSVLEA